ncbi:MAG TPA: hypothetical protein VMT00_16330 [Thermoanaerobaculia bacterium]|nr:hypothetical protein [Thermoanaerobaculia bacterium]
MPDHRQEPSPRNVAQERSPRGRSRRRRRGKAALSVRPPRERVILVARSDIAVRIVATLGEQYELLVFNSLDELAMWSSGLAPNELSLHREIGQALAECGVTLDTVSDPLRKLLLGLAQHTHVPSLDEWIGGKKLRRSFYRLWSAEILQRPSCFLVRVRVLHAVRLMTAGQSTSQAAAQAGFSSAHQLRRKLWQQGETNVTPLFLWHSRRPQRREDS